MPGHTSLSLERKLPLLISILLLLLTVGLTSAGYQEVRRTSELRGIERLQRLVAQVAELGGTSTEQRLAALQRVAADERVLAQLATRDADATSEAAARVALRGLSLTPTDTAIVAELRSSADVRQVATHPELEMEDQPVATLIATLSRGRAALGDLYRRGDSAFYWLGAPVTRNGRILGYVVQRRTFTAQPRTMRLIRELYGGDSVSIYFASDSSAIWASLGGTPTPVPTLMGQAGDPPNVLRYARSAGNEYVAVYASIPNTPLRVVAESPQGTLVERANAFLRRSIVVASLMLVIGIVAAWLLSRHITRPLLELTAAAEALATGDYAQRAHVTRRDETGRLAEAFNTMARQVQRSHDDLEQQNEASRALAARLDEANRTKADFLATMSHELRTPLNAIGGYVDLLDLGVRGSINAEQRRDLERVRYNQRHLLTLIGNILDFARLDAQKLPYDITEVRVDRVVADVLTTVSPLLDEKGLQRECVGCDAALVVRADRARLEQILLNLLSNAVRFTPAGGRVTVALARRGEKVEVVVADTGIGIPPEKLSAIFEPFVQVESGLTRTVGGTGLGLTISRELARAMGGDVAVTNNADGGARFTLTLPAVPSGTAHPSNVVAAVASSG